MPDDLDSIRTTVARIADEGPLAGSLRAVEVEPALDGDGDEFLRVMLRMKLPRRGVDQDLLALLERIEDAVSAIDPRYPSVRFLRAA